MLTDPNTFDIFSATRRHSPSRKSAKIFAFLTCSTISSSFTHHTHLHVLADRKTSTVFLDGLQALRFGPIIRLNSRYSISRCDISCLHRSSIHIAHTPAPGSVISQSSQRHRPRLAPLPKIASCSHCFPFRCYAGFFVSPIHSN
jgi:hypothetical protein